MKRKTDIDSFIETILCELKESGVSYVYYKKLQTKGKLKRKLVGYQGNIKEKQAENKRNTKEKQAEYQGNTKKETGWRLKENNSAK